ncbi:MAG: RcpC/CpaB family pilus assembly protein [Actinomycetota bacterium]
MGRRTIVLVIAIVLAAVSAYAVWSYLTSVEDDIRADIAEVRVYRAAEPIETKLPGEEALPFIEESLAMVRYVAFEGSTIICEGPKAENEGEDPATWGCPDNPSDLDSTLEGKVAAGPISPGQLITTDQWVEITVFEDVSLSEEIEQGKVAIGIQPEDVAAAGGFIRPGDHVNLLASASIEVKSFIELLSNPEIRELVLGIGFDTEGTASTTTEGTGAPGEEAVDPVAGFVETFPESLDFTQTILQDLEVLAVGADTPPNRIGSGLEPVGSQIIVLEVTPAQAEQIEFARQYTSVAMALLPSDVPYTPFESTGVIVDDLFTLIDRIQAQVEAAFGDTGN